MKTPVSRTFGALAVLAAAALVAVGCGSDSKDGNKSNKLAADQVFTYNIGSEPTTIDPPKGQDITSALVSTQLLAPLYRFEGDDAELTPFLADGLPEVSEDGLTYTIKIREDAEWSNGDPLTADDVVYSAQRALSPETAAYFASFFDSVVGVCEYRNSGDEGDPSSCEGEKTDGRAESIGITAVDDHTVEFKLTQVVPWFDQLLATYIVTPVPQKAIEAHGDKWTEPENIVTSGPFTLSEWKHEQSMTLTKSDSWWGADDMEIETVNLEMIAEPQSALRKFEAGDLDSGYPGTMVPTAETDRLKGTDEYHTSPSAATNYIYFNTTNPELKDPKVRQGLALAMNRKAIVENITKRGDIPLKTAIPTGLPGYDTVAEGSQDFLPTDTDPDVDQAKELLAEGGWKDGTELSMYFTTETGNMQAIAEQLQSDMKEVGVNVKLVPLTTFNELVAPGIASSPVGEKVDMVSIGWIADYYDPQDWYQLFTCANVEAGLNTSNFCNKEYDAVYEEALGTVDTDARNQLYRQLEGMLTGPEGQMPASPLYQDAQDTVIQEWVDGLYTASNGLNYFELISITEH